MSFVSILIPIFNGIEFLEECIDSVILQTFSNWEILIGINGHGDDGGNVAFIANTIASKDSRIKVYVQPPPLKGKVESLNDLMKKTTSKWICILDCDDKWESTKLEKQIKAIEMEATEASVIGTFCKYFGDRDGSPTIPSGYINPNILESYNPIINSSAMIKREYCYWEYNDINYGIEDFHLWMMICLKGGKLYNIPEYLTWHRVHITSSFNYKGYSDEPLRIEYKKNRNQNSI